MVHPYSVFFSANVCVCACMCVWPLQEQSKANLLTMKMMQLGVEGGWAHMLPVLHTDMLWHHQHEGGREIHMHKLHVRLFTHMGVPIRFPARCLCTLAWCLHSYFTLQKLELHVGVLYAGLRTNCSCRLDVSQPSRPHQHHFQDQRAAEHSTRSCLKGDKPDPKG